MGRFITGCMVSFITACTVSYLTRDTDTSTVLLVHVCGVQWMAIGTCTVHVHETTHLVQISYYGNPSPRYRVGSGCRVCL